MDTQTMKQIWAMLAVTGVLLWLDYKIQQRMDLNRMHRDIDRYLQVPFRDGEGY